jgi:histidine triad (HIT) family protein
MTEHDHPEHDEPNETVRLKHLDYIQSIVDRMSHSSTQAKSWLLPVVTATFGYALTQRSGTVALLGIAAILFFGYMDASYLRQERAYRRLYNAVVAGKKIPELSLDPHDVDRKIPDADGDPSPEDESKKKLGFWESLWKLVRGWFFADPAVWFSWSIFPFYFGFLAVGTAVFCYAVAH